MPFILIITLALIAIDVARANTAPDAFTYQGRIFKSDGTTPLDSAQVNFTVQIYSPDGSCLLYEENHVRNMSQSAGVFSLNVGRGANTNASPLTIPQVFENGTAKTGASSCQYTPSTGDSRRLRMIYADSSETVTLPADQWILSVPFALSAGSLDGKTKEDFLGVTTNTTANRVDDVFSRYTDLMGLLAGTSNLYAKAGDLSVSNGVLNLSSGGVSVADEPAQGNMAVNKNYADAKLGGRGLDLSNLASGSVLSWNDSAQTWQAGTVTSGTVTSIMAGSGLTGGTITANGTIALEDVGTAGTYSKVTTDSHGRVVAGSALQVTDLPNAVGDVTGALDGLTVAKLRGINLSGSTPTDNQILKYNSSANEWQPATVSMGGGITSVTASSPLSVANGSSSPAISLSAGTSSGQGLLWNGTAWAAGFSNLSSMKSSSGLTQLPTTSCGVGKTLVYLTPSDTYSCSNIQITNSQVTGLGNAATLNVGTAVGTVAAGDDSRLVGAVQSSTALSGDLSGTIASATVAKIQSVAVASTAPANGQFLKYNSSTTRWEPGAANAGTVTSVATGTGLTGGPITASGTLAVDVGTGASKIVQLDSSARLPAVDGSQLINLPAPFGNTRVFNTTGVTAWTVPANVTKIFVQAWGAGGSGGGGTGGGTGASGGAAGGFASGFVTVTPGASVNVTVGVGGTAAAVGADGTDGGASSYGTLIVANGGAKGRAASAVITVGGTTSGANAAITINGGAGQGGTVNVSFVGALGGNGGAAGGGGGAGGSGGANTTTAASDGIQPGGGGGGGGSTSATGSAGGNGGNGRVLVWY